MLEEAGRSLHDALCVIRCLVKQRALIAGGGAPEIELALKLGEYAVTLGGIDAYCIKAFANALEVSIKYILIFGRFLRILYYLSLLKFFLKKKSRLV